MAFAALTVDRYNLTFCFTKKTLLISKDIRRHGIMDTTNGIELFSLFSQG